MIIDDFILKNGLKWIPYNKFKNIKYLNEGGFGTIYRAIWLKNNGNEDDEEVILKCPKNLNENLNEFLKEWEYHTSVLSSYDIINIYGFTEDPNTSKYIIVMYYANKGNLRENLTRLVKSNWNQKLFMLYEIISGLNPLKRPSSEEVCNIIKEWIIPPDKIENINEELKCNIAEFINAPIGHNNLVTESHPKACYTSRLLDFTSKKLNEILESENLDDCIINDDMKSLDENTSKKLNEIHEKANEMLVNDEDLNDYIYN
ncbi:uncharacterized protein OCT59_007872 [Rhizophagus irregularis]|uniref:uncharacterized protein n=1 Tax=Rhizophagus irregularis TaxID=588596 RepID=UPI00332A237C|nr:hypothetical protein OCT59_007872 [Rhizophagus irregularis]